MLTKILSKFFLEIFEKHYCKRKKGYTQKLECVTHKQSNLPLFGPSRAHWSYLVHSYLVHFIFIWSIPIWLYSVHLGPIRPIQFIHFYLVYFGPFDSIRSTYMVLFSPLRSIWFYLVHFIQFSVIRSFCFLFVNFGPYWCTYIMRKDIFELRAPILNPNLLYIYIYI